MADSVAHYSTGLGQQLSSRRQAAGFSMNLCDLAVICQCLRSFAVLVPSASLRLLHTVASTHRLVAISAGMQVRRWYRPFSTSNHHN